MPEQIITPDQGLAQQSAQQAAGPMRAIQDIAKMLMSGVTPEELLQQGVPRELVEAAMELLNQQVTQVPPEEAGLAAMSLDNTMITK